MGAVYIFCVWWPEIGRIRREVCYSAPMVGSFVTALLLLQLLYFCREVQRSAVEYLFYFSNFFFNRGMVAGSQSVVTR